MKKTILWSAIAVGLLAVVLIAGVIVANKVNTVENSEKNASFLPGYYSLERGKTSSGRSVMLFSEDGSGTCFLTYGYSSYFCGGNWSTGKGKVVFASRDGLFRYVFEIEGEERLKYIEAESQPMTSLCDMLKDGQVIIRNDASVMEKQPNLLNIARNQEVHIIASENASSISYVIFLGSVEHITWEKWFNEGKRMEEEEVKFILSYNNITEEQVTLHPYIVPYSSSLPSGEAFCSSLNKRFDGKYKVEQGFKVYDE